MISWKCPRCGRQVENFMIGGLCVDCYFEQNDLSKKFFDAARFSYCPYCGRIKVGHSWKFYSGIEEISSVIEKRLSKIVERIPLHDKEISKRIAATPLIEEGTINVDVLFDYKDKMLKKSWRITNAITKEMCPECLKRKIGDYSALVQIRLEGLSKEVLTRELEKMFSHRIFSALIEIEELSEGIDIKFSDQSSARMLANKLSSAFPAEVHESFKLISERGGEKISRLTISVRLYSDKIWSLGEFGDKPILFKKTKGGKILIKELTSQGKQLLRDSSFAKLIRPFRGTYSIVQIISLSDDKYYAIDAQSFNFYEVPKERAFGPLSQGDEAILIFTEQGEYIIARRILKEV